MRGGGGGGVEERDIWDGRRRPGRGGNCLTISIHFKLMKCVHFIFFTGSTEAGECCKAYTDIAGNYHSVQWCPNYCCGTVLIGYLSCCDNAARQAPADERLGFCELWWKNHV